MNSLGNGVIHSDQHPLFKPEKSRTPEERELKIKQAELNRLRPKLAQRELDLTTLEIELHSFEIRYLKIVGSRYATLDELEAKIAEHKAALNLKNIVAQKSAKAARKKADESAQRSQAANSILKKAEFKPSQELKKLYREVAKQIHPDLSGDEDDRLRREHLMSDANNAFANGNVERLRQILHEWESSPESVKGDGTAVELVRTIRKIAQVRERLRVLEGKITDLQQSDLWMLKIKVEEAKSANSDLLAQMATVLDGRIAAAQIELEVLLKTTMS